MKVGQKVIVGNNEGVVTSTKVLNEILVSMEITFREPKSLAFKNPSMIVLRTYRK